MKIEIRRAKTSEAKKLSGIAFDAKRYWKYPEEWIQLWADELTVSAGYIDENHVLVALADHHIVGWCSITPTGTELDYCWVRPEALAKGVGKQLVGKAFEVAAELKSATLKVIADPNAEGFYAKLGFSRVGAYPSVPAGRMLPAMEANCAAQIRAGT